MPEQPLPEYVPYGPLSDLDLDDPGAVLKTHLRWITSNADRFVQRKDCSPGVVSDAITKTIDQWLDHRKLAADAGFDEDPEDVALGFKFEDAE